MTTNFQRQLELLLRRGTALPEGYVGQQEVYQSEHSGIQRGQLDRMMQMMNDMSSQFGNIISKHQEDEWLIEGPQPQKPRVANQRIQTERSLITHNDEQVNIRIAGMDFQSNRQVMKEQSVSPPSKALVKKQKSTIQQSQQIEQQQLIEPKKEQQSAIKKQTAPIQEHPKPQIQSHLITNRLPIYLRAEQELQRKEVKLHEIKQQAEQEKRQKMITMGIQDEEEIIRKKREKDIFLKDKFNLDNFESKYQKELKQREEKKRKLEENVKQKVMDACTFKPEISKRSQQLSKSPTQERNLIRSSTSSLQSDVILKESKPSYITHKSPQPKQASRNQHVYASSYSYRNQTQEQLTHDLLMSLRKETKIEGNQQILKTDKSPKFRKYLQEIEIATDDQIEKVEESCESVGHQRNLEHILKAFQGYQ